MILGCFFGAGFVSGREISFYFARFGEYSVFAIICASILFFILTMLFFLLSKRSRNFYEFTQNHFGRASSAVNILLALSLLIISGSMLAGTRAFAIELNMDMLVLIIVTLILTFWIVKGNTKYVSKINLYLIPFLLVVLVVISLKRGGERYRFDGNSLQAIISGGNYVFINIVTLGMFILEIGNKYTLRQQFMISIISSIIISIILYLLCRAIIFSNLIDSMMPNLVLSSNSPILFVCMQICIYLGLFTTYIANIFVLSNFINKYIVNKSLAIVVSLFLSIVISIFKFDVLVGYVYTIIGIIGIIIVLGSLCTIRKNKQKDGAG